MQRPTVMLQQSMRWLIFVDPISRAEIRQAGCTGVVVAPHDVAKGTVWTAKAITASKDLVKGFGLTRSVVESLPVHDAIKLAAPGRKSNQVLEESVA